VDQFAARLQAQSDELHRVVVEMINTAKTRFEGWHAETEDTYKRVSGVWNQQAFVMRFDLLGQIASLKEKVFHYQTTDRRLASGI
jgi:hypothetical protein